jgi:diguanylate cyclase (GGDEF)-like protein
MADLFPGYYRFLAISDQELENRDVSTRRRFLAVISTALVALLTLAAPAGADLPGLGGGGGDGSSLPGTPLDQLPGGNPLDGLLPPGTPDPGDELEKILPPTTTDPNPTPQTSKPSSSPKAGNPSQPKQTAVKTGTRPRASLTSTQTSARTSTNGRSTKRGAVRSGGSTTAAAKAPEGLELNAFHRSTPKAAQTAPPTDSAGSSSFVGQVIDKIPPQYRAAVLALTCVSLFFALVSLRERRRSMRAERQALVDVLTRLPNRNAFERRLAKEWKRSERYERPLGMLLLDLDGFKEINDTEGHAAGDRVLCEAASAIEGRIRASDMAARLGGDEFVVLCPETSMPGLTALARSLEERLQEASIRSSIGFAEREAEDEDADDLVARADAAMYECKQRGKVKVERRHKKLSAAKPLASTAD